MYITDYIASSGMNNKAERTNHGLIKALRDHLPVETGENHKNITQDSQYASQSK
jgi:hypothetical protein